ncbi:hypothetical protein VTP01DRAFT_10164 [Rhizomucor pusillus]|uniref:uncharacterized protein n=1 Tax=Rhizomucor pusillus TaxID=4840 RepID=UPI0037427F3F
MKTAIANHEKQLAEWQEKHGNIGKDLEAQQFLKERAVDLEEEFYTLTKQPNDIEPELNAKGEHGTELEKQLENTESKRKAAKEEEEQQQQLDKVQNAYSQLRSKHSANLKELGLREKRKSLENAAKTSKTQVQRELHSKLQEMDERRQEIETLRRQLAILEESNQANKQHKTMYLSYKQNWKMQKSLASNKSMSWQEN